MFGKFFKFAGFILIIALLLTIISGAEDYAGGTETGGSGDLEDLGDGGDNADGENGKNGGDGLFLGEDESEMWIIKFKTDIPAEKEKQFQDELRKVTEWGFAYIANLDLYVVRVDDLDKNPTAVANRFKNSEFIEFAEPNYSGTLDRSPTDPDYNADAVAAAGAINAEAGWDVATKSGVLVAIVDSGYAKNRDLPDASGYNVLNGGFDLSDNVGHGTQVAGALGAVANNGFGNAGIIWEANLMPIKITESANVTVAYVAAAVAYAADNGAKIINLSLSFTTDSKALKTAADYAYKKGCVIVASVGNDGKDVVYYPAAYDNVLGVGGISAIDGTRVSASNYGEGLDVLASWSWPTTSAAGVTTIMYGTSIAAPQVAGLAALAWELAPNLTNGEIMDIIRGNTAKNGPGKSTQTGYGTIDMGKTLAYAKNAAGSGTNKSGGDMDIIKKYNVGDDPGFDGFEQARDNGGGPETDGAEQRQDIENIHIQSGKDGAVSPGSSAAIPVIVYEPLPDADYGPEPAVTTKPSPAAVREPNGYTSFTPMLEDTEVFEYAKNGAGAARAAEDSEMVGEGAIAAAYSENESAGTANNKAAAEITPAAPQQRAPAASPDTADFYGLYVIQALFAAALFGAALHRKKIKSK